jgi:asparagine synthase (glutamine-hydrolysing)
MCGLFGLILPSNQAVERGVLLQASRMLEHRGPDDEGFLLANSTVAVAARGPLGVGQQTLPSVVDVEGHYHLAFAFRRLSILDLSPRGHQPMASPSGRQWIVFNGEIYNYIEIREELTATGVVFQTGADTEVFLAAYCAWGSACVHRLQGMFAAVIFDLDEGRAVILRDPFGIKPLYYTSYRGGVAFASEAKCLMSLPGVQRHVDAAILHQYLRFGERYAGENTLIVAIKQLPAASSAEIRLSDPATISTTKYWSPPQDTIDVSEAEAITKTKALLEQSVRLHLRSDVPVGVCLSGGLDSTAIALEMQRNLPPGVRVTGVSYISEDGPRSEEPYVDMVPGIGVQKVRATSYDFEHDVNDLIRTHDFPFISLSVYAQYTVFREAARSGLKVMLDGQGADEVFGGYAGHLPPAIASALFQGDFAAAASILGARGWADSRRWILGATAARLISGRWIWPRTTWAALTYPKWLDQGWFDSRDSGRPFRPWPLSGDALHNEIRLGITDLSLPQLLRYEDQNSMRFSVESRVPFCDRPLIDYVLRLPREMLVDAKGTTKYVLRRAVEDVVPKTIINRPKVGFDASDQIWLRQSKAWVHGRLRFLDSGRLNFLRADATRHFVTQGLQSHKMGTAVWRVLNLLAWAEHYDVSFE